MADIATLSVLLKVKDESKKSLDQAQGRFARFNDSIKQNAGKIRGFGTALTGFGLATLGVLALGIKSVNEQERGIRKLDVALQGVGSSYASSRKEIERTITSLQRKTNFGDEEQREVLTRLVAVIGDEEKALQALPAVLDAAAFSGRSATTVSETLSKFMVGLTNTSDATGVSVDATADFTERLAAVMGVAAGHAEADADKFIQLKNSMGDVHQAIVIGLLPALEKMAAFLTKVAVKVTAFAEEHPHLTKVIVIAAAALGTMSFAAGVFLLILPTLVASITILTGAFAALTIAMGPITLIILALAAVVLAGIVIWKKWDDIIHGLSIAFDFISEAYRSKLGWLLPGGALIKAILFLKDVWGAAWKGTQTVFETASDGIKTAYESKWGWLLPGGTLIKAILWIRDNWKPIWDGVKDAFSTASAGIKTAYESNFGWLLPGGTLIKAILWIRDNWKPIWDGTKTTFSTACDGIKTAYGSNFGWLLPGGALIKAILWIRDNWKPIWDGAKDAFSTASAGIKFAYESNFGWLLPGGALIKAIIWNRDNWKPIWDGVKTTFSAAGTGIQTAYESKWGWLLPGGALIKAILFIKENWNAVWGGIKDAFSIDFASPIKRAMEELIDFLNARIDEINAIPLLPDIPNIPGGTSNVRSGLQHPSYVPPIIPDIPTGLWHYRPDRSNSSNISNGASHSSHSPSHPNGTTVNATININGADASNMHQARQFADQVANRLNERLGEIAENQEQVRSS